MIALGLIWGGRGCSHAPEGIIYQIAVCVVREHDNMTGWIANAYLHYAGMVGCNSQLFGSWLDVARPSLNHAYSTSWPAYNK